MTKHLVLISIEGDYKISELRNFLNRLNFDMENKDKFIDFQYKLIQFED